MHWEENMGDEPFSLRTCVNCIYLHYSLLDNEGFVETGNDCVDDHIVLAFRKASRDGETTYPNVTQCRVLFAIFVPK